MLWLSARRAGICHRMIQGRQYGFKPSDIESTKEQDQNHTKTVEERQWTIDEVEIGQGSDGQSQSHEKHGKKSTICLRIKIRKMGRPFKRKTRRAPNQTRKRMFSNTKLAWACSPCIGIALAGRTTQVCTVDGNFSILGRSRAREEQNPHFLPPPFDLAHSI